MKVILLGALLVVAVFSAIDCPNGVFLAPEGNDTAGNGTIAAPFKSYQRSLEHFHQNGVLNALICLLPGTYEDVPTAEYSIGPFDSIVLVPADKTNPTLPFIREAFYFVNGTANFDFSLFNIHRVVVSSYNSNFHFSDLHSDNNDAGITIFTKGSTQSNSIKSERLFGIGFEASVNAGQIYSSVTIDNSYLFYTHIDDCDTVSITNSHIQSEVTVKANTAISIIGCEASHLNYTVDTLNLLSLFPLGNSFQVNFNSNRFFNNTLYSTYAMELLLINSMTYTLNYEDNYFSCNYGYATSSNASYLLPLLPDMGYKTVTANIIGNIVDQTCPSSCPPGKGPFYQGLTCANCPSNFASPDGKECVPCPPGTDIRYGTYNCTQCPTGKFNPSLNTSCTTCQTGTPNQNSTACVPCPLYYYSDYEGLCKACDKYDYLVHQECPQCTFFQEPPTCTQFSTDAKIMIGGVVGGVLLMIVFGVFLACFRKKQYTSLN